MQAAQRKVLDVINSVGLSDSLLRVIDRRQRLDRWITYSGMVRCVCTYIEMMFLWNLLIIDCIESSAWTDGSPTAAWFAVPFFEISVLGGP